jgi:hypothetical protein
MRKKCKCCGGKVVAGLDKRGKCPECVRLNTFQKDVGIGFWAQSIEAVSICGQITAGYRKKL